MRRPRLSRRTGCLLLFVVAILLVRWRNRAPSEAEMIANFHQHKAEFEQLRRMLGQDNKIGMIGSDWIRNQEFSSVDTPQQVGISQQRLELYHAMMRRLGVYGVSHNLRENYYQYNVFGGGFTDTSWGIGYVWSREVPEKVVVSAYNTMPGRDRRIHSLIEGNWYIFHRR